VAPECSGAAPPAAEVPVADPPSATQADCPSEPEWFALVVGAAYVKGRHPLPRAAEQVDEVAKKLKEIQPGLNVDGHVIALGPREASREGLHEARRVLLGKMASTTEARLIFHFGGHGHQNHMVLLDGMEPIDAYLEKFQYTTRDEKYEFAQATRPQIIGFFDACRSPVPEGAEGAAPAPFKPKAPWPKDGRTYFFYATTSGRDATDGNFTDKLLEKLDEPGYTLAELIDAVSSSITKGQRVESNSTGDQMTRIVIHPRRRGSSCSTGATASTIGPWNELSDSVVTPGEEQ